MPDEIIGARVEVDTGALRETVKSVDQLKAELTEAEKVAEAIGKQTGTTNKYYAEAVAKVKDLQQQLSSAATAGSKLGEGVQKAVAPVTSLRTLIREAKNELDAANEAFGVTSTEAITAAKKLGELKDRFADLNAQADAFNPDKKFAAFGQVAQGVVGGFTAIQGAIALVGADSEDLQKSLVKVQAALALSQGLNNIIATRDSFNNLISVVKNLNVVQTLRNFILGQEATAQGTATVAAEANTVATEAQTVATTAATTATIALRGALVATGIGAVIVLIVAAVAALEKYSSAAANAAKEQQRLNDAIKEGADAQLAGETAFLDREEKFAVARAKAAGKSEAEIFAIQQDYEGRKLRSLQRYRQEVRGDLKASTEADGKILEQSDKKQLAELDHQADELKTRRAAEKTARDKAAADAKKTDAEALADAKRQREALDALDNNLFKGQRANNPGIDIDQGLIDADKKQREDATNLANFLSTTKLQSEILQTQAQQEQGAARLKLAKLEREGRLEELSLISQGLDSFSELAGKQTAVGKALGIASTIISTYTSAQKAYESQLIPGDPTSPVRAAIAAGVAIAGGLQRLKEIVKVQVPGGGGGSAGSINSASPAGAAAPIGPAPTTQLTALDAQSINQLNNKAVKAYVVLSDVQGQSDRYGQIVNDSTFH